MSPSLVRTVSRPWRVTAIAHSHDKDQQAHAFGATHFIVTNGRTELEKAALSFDFILSTVLADLCSVGVPERRGAGSRIPCQALSIAGVRPRNACAVNSTPLRAAEESRYNYCRPRLVISPSRPIAHNHKTADCSSHPTVDDRPDLAVPAFHQSRVLHHTLYETGCPNSAPRLGKPIGVRRSTSTAPARTGFVVWRKIAFDKRGQRPATRSFRASGVSPAYDARRTRVTAVASNVPMVIDGALKTAAIFFSVAAVNRMSDRSRDQNFRYRLEPSVGAELK